MLAAILLFFVSQSFVMAAYNVLIRKTARSQRFFRSVDALSAVLAVWSVGNMVLAGMSLSAQASPPVDFRLFRHLSLGNKLTCAVLVHGRFRRTHNLLVHRTAVVLPVDCLEHVRTVASQDPLVNLYWDLHTVCSVLRRAHRSEVGADCPREILTKRSACLGAIITRLTISPADLFAKDWTLASINVVLTLTCEVFFSVMNLLAPSLPVFFDQTSTGSLHYVPGNNWSRTTPSSGRSQTAGGIGTRQSTRVEPDFNSNARQANDLAELSKMRTTFSTSIHRQEESKRTSFDSDAILVRRSVEIR